MKFFYVFLPMLVISSTTVCMKDKDRHYTNMFIGSGIHSDIQSDYMTVVRAKETNVIDCKKSEPYKKAVFLDIERVKQDAKRANRNRAIYSLAAFGSVALTIPALICSFPSYIEKFRVLELGVRCLGVVGFGLYGLFLAYRADNNQKIASKKDTKKRRLMRLRDSINGDVGEEND